MVGERESFASGAGRLEEIWGRAGVRKVCSCLRDLKSCFGVEIRAIAWWIAVTSLAAMWAEAWCADPDLGASSDAWSVEARRGRSRHRCPAICCSSCDLVMSVIDADEIGRRRCWMGKLIGEQMADSTADCARLPSLMDPVIGCKRDLAKSINISRMRDARWDYTEVSIVFGFDIASFGAVGCRFRFRFHCRCGTDCTAGSLAASATLESSDCLMDKISSRDSVKSIVGGLCVGLAVFVRSYLNYWIPCWSRRAICWALWDLGSCWSPDGESKSPTSAHEYVDRCRSLSWLADRLRDLRKFN